MILLDLNQVAYSTISTQFQELKRKKVDLNEDLIRHMILNCIRSYRTKFKNTYGEIVIATDSRQYWRRDIFPYYKANRKATRDASGLPWPLIFEAMNKLKAELQDNFPYRYIEVLGAEADDIIAVLTRQFHTEDEPTLIISSDKDFIQLSGPKVKQWDPLRKRWLSSPSPKGFLLEHILKGDVGDGIPNVKAADDSIVIKNRAPPITKKFLNSFDLNTCNAEVKRNYYRNKTLIDLTCIPESVRLEIVKTYDNSVTPDRSKLFNYFIKNNLKGLMASLQEF